MSTRASAISVTVLLALSTSSASASAAVAACRADTRQQNGSATVVQSANSITGDGLGSYIDGQNYTKVNAVAALNLFPFRASTPGATPRRHLIVDLNNPVPNGGGEPRGVVSSWSGPHAYWFVDSDMFVHSVQEIPKGATVLSDLTAIFVSSDDGASKYLLQMGPWAWSTCEDTGVVSTAGSTRVAITRTGQKTWTAKAPNGSIAVLHDMTDPQNPIALGLYYVSFEIRFAF